MNTVPGSLEIKGFVKSPYNFNFESFITLRAIRLLCVLVTTVYSLGSVVAFIVLLAEHSPASIISALIAVPIPYLVYLTIAHISLDVTMVVFNIDRNGRSIRGDAVRPSAPGQPSVSAL